MRELSRKHFIADEVKLIRRVRKREINNVVERLHRTLKDRLKPMRELKREETAQTFLETTPRS